MNHDGVPLENRIATALAAIDITSTDLSQLVVEAEAAISAADNAAEDERAKALDPALSPDPKAARQAMEDAAFMRDRLKTLLPRLQTRYREIADAEALAAWRPKLTRCRRAGSRWGQNSRMSFPSGLARLSISYGKCTTSIGRSLRSTVAVPMPRTPPAFVRSIGSRLHSRNISRFPIPKRAQSIGRSGRVDLAIYGRRANWTRGSSWRA